MPAAQEKRLALTTTDQQPALDPSSLPLSTDHSLILEVATLPEYEHTWRLNASEWKGFLSVPSYLDRELLLNDTEMTKDGKASSWILTSPNLPLCPDASRPILAACETFLKDAYIIRNGKLEQVRTHGIGSVYCRPEYRGRGYAGKMFEKLGEKLETWQQLKGKQSQFSVLYSDIGPKFYAKYGWKPFPSTHVSLKPITFTQYEQYRSQHHNPQIEDLRDSDLQTLSLLPQFEDKITRLSSSTPDKTFVAFKPDLALFQWHFAREEYLAEILNRERPEIKGAINRKTGIALIWVRTYGADRSTWHLSVLYVHVPRDAGTSHVVVPVLAALLLRAQLEAERWDMEQGVEVWDPRDEIIEAAKMVGDGRDVRVFQRHHEHICSLRWNGAETDEVVWLANERYAWC